MQCNGAFEAGERIVLRRSVRLRLSKKEKKKQSNKKKAVRKMNAKGREYEGGVEGDGEGNSNYMWETAEALRQ
jgi:hypothetical protein